MAMTVLLASNVPNGLNWSVYQSSTRGDIVHSFLENRLNNLGGKGEPWLFLKSNSQFFS
jgi:hypothetical protein